MSKKTYNINFIYSDKNENVEQHSISNINKSEKDEVIQKTCQWLMYEKEAASIVVNEKCTYKIL